MKKQSAAPIPEVPGIDLSYRPHSYFWPLGLDTHLLARIKGAERKAALRRLIDSGNLEEIPDFLAQSALSEADRKMFGRLHPAFMGGEYLPNLASHEVQIARVTIASTTQDVTSVYARRTKRRIVYRVVDEYEGETLSEKRTRTSVRPLTLRELETFLDGAWSIYGVLAMNFEDNDLEAMLQFVIDVDSQFYPQLDALYRHRIEDWASVRRGDLGQNHSASGDTEAPSPAQHKEPVKPAPPPLQADQRNTGEH